MPTTCRLKHLCSIRAWVPVSFFLSFLSFLLSLFQANSLEHGGPLSPLSCRGFLDPLEKAPCAFTHSRGRPVPTCSSASPKNRTLLAFCVNQGMSASFSLSLSGPPGSGPLKDQQMSYSVSLDHTANEWKDAQSLIKAIWRPDSVILNNPQYYKDISCSI